jgi:hypothetical protein
MNIKVYGVNAYVTFIITYNHIIYIKHKIKYVFFFSDIEDPDHFIRHTCSHQYNHAKIVNSCQSSLKFQSDTLYDIVQYYIKNPSENVMNGMLKTLVDFCKSKIITY